MLNISSRVFLTIVMLLTVSAAHGQNTKVVVIPLFGDDAASKWLGPWVESSAYKVSDIVESNGSSYIATSNHQSSLSNMPGLTDAPWELVAASGANGIAGIDGADGEVGPAGSAGADGQDGAIGPIGPVGPKGDPGDPAVVNPSISFVNPARAFLDREIRVTISGNGTEWAAGVTADFGAGINVTDLIVASPTALVATIDVTGLAPVGLRDVTVNYGGDSSIFAGAFAVESSFSVSTNGTIAQGSVVFVDVVMLDPTTPFSSSADDITMMVGESTGNVNEDDSHGFDLSGLIFIDVNATAGLSDLVVSSLRAGTTTVSRSADAFDIQARTATILVPGIQQTVMVATPLETSLFQLDIPAETVMLVEATTSGLETASFLAVPGTGVVADFISFGSLTSIFNPSAAPATYYLVTWNNVGESGFDIALNATATATSIVALAGSGVTMADISTAGESDWYSIELGFDETLSATIGDGASDTCGSVGMIDSEVEIYDVDGSTSLTLNDDISPTNYCSSASITAPAAGTYFIRTSGSAQFCTTCTYDYSLTVEVD